MTSNYMWQKHTLALFSIYANKCCEELFWTYSTMTWLSIMVPYIALKIKVFYLIAIMKYIICSADPKQMFFWKLLNISFSMNAYNSSTKCSTTVTLQTELFIRKMCNLYSTLKQLWKKHRFHWSLPALRRVHSSYGAQLWK